MKTLKLLFCCIVVALAYGKSAADSYDIYVPANGQEVAAFSFTNATIGNSIFGAPDWTVIYQWDAENQEYMDANTRFPWGWSNPNAVLHPGEGFIILNQLATNIYISVTGTPLASTNFTMYFPVSTNWYLVGSAYPLDLYGGNYLECLSSGYTTNSLNYVGHTNDQAYLWDRYNQYWDTYTRTLNGQGGTTWGVADYVSPIIALTYPNSSQIGKGFFLRPAGGTTNWIHLKYGATCWP